MNEHLIAIKVTITAALTALAAFLGWKGVVAVVWVAVMALDYISGTAAACKAGEWSSEAARQGLWHKAAMIFVVIVAAIADGVLAVLCAHLELGPAWPGLVLPLVLAWYILTEFGSILENAVNMGAAVPGWLTKLLKAGLSAVDKVGDGLDGTEQED